VLCLDELLCLDLDTLDYGFVLAVAPVRDGDLATDDKILSLRDHDDKLFLLHDQNDKLLSCCAAAPPGARGCGIPRLQRVVLNDAVRHAAPVPNNAELHAHDTENDNKPILQNYPNNVKNLPLRDHDDKLFLLHDHDGKLLCCRAAAPLGARGFGIPRLQCVVLNDAVRQAAPSPNIADLHACDTEIEYKPVLQNDRNFAALHAHDHATDDKPFLVNSALGCELVPDAPTLHNLEPKIAAHTDDLVSDDKHFLLHDPDDKPLCYRSDALRRAFGPDVPIPHCLVPNVADLHVNDTVSDDKPHPQNDPDDEIPPSLIREVQEHYEVNSMDFDGCCPLGCGAKDFVGHFRSCNLAMRRCKKLLRSLLECPAQLQRPSDPDKFLWACFQGLHCDMLGDDSLSAASLVDDVPLPPPPPLPSAPVPPLRRYDSDYFPGSDDEWECERTDDQQILQSVKHMDPAQAELTMSLYWEMIAATTSENSGSAAGCKRQHSTNIAPTPASPTSEYSGAAGCKHHFRTSK